MGETHRNTEPERGSVGAAEPQWIDDLTDTGEPRLSSVGRPPRQPVVIAAVAGIIALAALLLALTGSVDIEAAEPPTSDAAPTIRRTAPPVSGTTTSVTTTTTIPAAPVLAASPVAWRQGLAIAFVDQENVLQLIDMADGRSIVGNQWATFAWPPLPDELQLIGAPNRSFAIDPRAPGDSGRISTTVHTVRLAEDADSFGFFSTTEQGYEFFIGSQWGPAQNGLAVAPDHASVFPVHKRGIVVSQQDGSSQILTLEGLVDLPTRLGRIVSASADQLLGVHCDDLGRCLGRLTNWDVEDELRVPIEVAANNLVSLSPDGGYILSASTTTWGVYDIAAGTFAAGDPRVQPRDAVAWTPDGSHVAWVERGVIVTVEATEPVAFEVPLAELDEDRVVGAGAELRIVSLF